MKHFLKNIIAFAWSKSVCLRASGKAALACCVYLSQVEAEKGIQVIMAFVVIVVILVFTMCLFHPLHLGLLVQLVPLGHHPGLVIHVEGENGMRFKSHDDQVAPFDPLSCFLGLRNLGARQARVLLHLVIDVMHVEESNGIDKAHQHVSRTDHLPHHDVRLDGDAHH